MLFKYLSCTVCHTCKKLAGKQYTLPWLQWIPVSGKHLMCPNWYPFRSKGKHGLDVLLMKGKYTCQSFDWFNICYIEQIHPKAVYY